MAKNYDFGTRLPVTPGDLKTCRAHVDVASFENGQCVALVRSDAQRTRFRHIQYIEPFIPAWFRLNELLDECY